MTVSLGDLSKEFSVKVYPRDISRNLLLSLAFDGTDEGLTIQGKAKTEGMLDLTANTATGFSTNGYAPAFVADWMESRTKEGKLVRAGNMIGQKNCMVFTTETMEQIVLKCKEIADKYDL
jgi:hypothetical protein